MRREKYKSGFSLLEFSVVMVILALIIASIIVGRGLVKQGKIRKVVSDINVYKIAANNFRLKYDSIAGDTPDATTFWSGTANGDGDRILDGNYLCTGDSETLRFWQHLSLSGIVPGSYTGLSAGVAPRCTIGSNVPETAIKGTFFYPWDLASVGQNIHGRSGNVFHWGSIAADNSAMGPVLNPAEGFSFDSKIDDGLPRSGEVYASSGNGVTNCETGSGYTVSNDDVVCRFWIFLDF